MAIMVLDFLLVVCVIFTEASLLPSIASLESRENCEVTGLRMTIWPPIGYSSRCNPTTIKTFGCRGQCLSYSEVDANLSRIMRSCSCCEPTEYGIQQAVMQCQDGVHLRKLVKFAIDCHCRPCFLSRPRLTVSDLRRLLQQSRYGSRIPG